MAARGCADLEIIPDRNEGREAPLELLVGFNVYRYQCQALETWSNDVQVADRPTF